MERVDIGSGVEGGGRGLEGRKSVGGPRGKGVKRLGLLSRVDCEVPAVVSCQRRLSQTLKRGDEEASS